MSTTENYDNDCKPIKEIEDVNEMKELALKCKKEKNYDNMIIYYEMAIKKNDVEAMILLANYYKRREPQKYENYMLLAIEEDASYTSFYRFLVKIEKSLIPPPYSSKFNTEQLDNHLATSMIQMGNISVQLPTKNQIKTKRDLETIINNVNTEIGNTNQYRNVARNIQKLVIYLNALSIKLGLQVQTHNFSKYGV